MNLICSTARRRYWVLPGLLLIAAFSMAMNASPAFGQHTLGIDTSSAANASSPTQTMWNTAFNEGYKFAILRSSRGGLTAAEQRLDDGQFYDGITRATAAGMLAGSYHFARADLSPTATPTPGTNTGAGDAQHYLQQAGMYMKPGYLLPVFDLEAGNTQNTTAQLTAWGTEWINTIFSAKGIYPIVYTNSSYNNDEVTAALAFSNIASSPHTGPITYQWLTRPGGDRVNGEPPAATLYPNPYGGWDPNFVSRTNSRDPAINPWAFWQQQGTTTDPSGIVVDYDAANGNIEFVKDFLVPALWTNASSGDWGTTANWNSDNPTYNGTIASGPAPRLPNNQSLDWVKLQNTGGGTVTISSGAQTVRKFYTQQPLNISGGSLSVAYSPGSGGKFDTPSEFNAAVTLAGGAAYSAHTTQVDGGGGTFNVNGGTVTFTDIQLASHASNSGKIVMGGDATFAPTGGVGTAIIRSTGSLAQAGSVSLSAGNRTFSVSDGAANVDLQVRAAVTGAGRLIKSGAGNMQLAGTNSYSGGTTVSAGILQVTADNQLGTAPGSLQSDNIVLDGGTLRTGARINSISLTNAGTNYASFPTMTLNGAGSDALAASANVLAGVRTIAVTAGGSGYVNQTPAAPPTANTAGTFVDIVGGGGSGATAYATVAGGVVTSITVVNAGSGYTSMPTIHISSTLPSGSTLAGTGATASVSGITLQSIALNDGGFDYTTPTVSLTGGGGSGAAATAASTPGLTLNSNRGVSLTANGGTLYQTAGTTLTIGGPVSSTGSGTLNKSGTGTLVLNGTNTYTGATSINAGTLQIGAAERIPDSSAVTVAVGSTFDLQNNNETIGSLAGGGSVTNVSILNAGGDNSSTTFSGTIAGSTLQKSGAGTLSLTGSNSYSGGTTILGGKLSGNSIANSGINSNFGTGNFSIANGGTLEYTGFSGSTNRTISLGSGGGNISVPTGVSTLSVTGIVDGSTLTKTGQGTLTLRGANTYTGGTTVQEGTLNVFGATAKLGTGNVTVNSVLSIQNGVANAIDDSATLSLLGGGILVVADQGYANLEDAINEVIGSLLLGAVPQAYGITYGSTDSTAIVKSDEYFAGAGMISVGLLGDFNNDHSVDAGDYVIWRTSPTTYGGSAGYDLWQANFGNTSPGAGSSLGGSSVPEPSSMALVIFGLATLLGHRRNR